jgi:hypothetical protein
VGTVTRPSKKLRDARPHEYIGITVRALRDECRTSLQEVQGTKDIATVVMPASFVGAVAQWLDMSHQNRERDHMPVTEHAHAVRIAEAYWRLADFNAAGVVDRTDRRLSLVKKGDTDHA